MKKIFKQLIFICLLLGMTTAMRAQFSGGIGTTGNPYIITTAADLDNVRNFLSANFVLGNDIDLATYLSNGNPGYNGGAGWLPIGTFSPSNPFTGTFNGAGFRIYNLWINRPSTNYVGLFSYVSGSTAKIENLGVEIAAAGIIGQIYVGGLVGYVSTNATITNCYTTGNVTGKERIGGLIGQAYQVTAITNCYTTGNVHGTQIGTGFNDYVGGLVGVNSYSPISKCYTTGNVSGAFDVGGLVGANEYNGAIIENCYATGNVLQRGSINCAGGLAGANRGTTNSIIRNCYASGKIDGDDQVGGLSGMNSKTIQNCVAANDTLKCVGTDVARIRGFDSGTLSNNYANSAMIVNTGLGTSGVHNDENGANKTLADLKTQTFYTTPANWESSIAWNFSTIWTIWDNKSFPYFQTQSAPVYNPQANTAKVYFELQNYADSVKVNHYRGSTFMGTYTFTAVPLGANSRVLTSQKDDVLIFTVYEPSKTVSYPVQTITIAQYFCDGIGTLTNPYLICNEEQLDSVRYFLDKHFVLTQDIDLDTYISINYAANGWLPIGTLATPFTGTFNGKGYEVSNLWINRPSDNDVALFGYVKGATARIDSLGVEIAAQGIKGYGTVGGLVGNNNNHATIANCYVTGNGTVESATNGYVGGLAGGNTVNSTIENCYATVNVSGNDWIGGLVGYNFSSSITNCYATGNVSGNNFVGVLVGDNGGTISNCYATGNVSGLDFVGGLVGDNGGTISNCYATGNVSGNDNVGGLTGDNWGYISNCYATVNVSGNNFVGGLTGENLNDITNCVAANDTIVGTGTDINRIVGYNSGTLTNNYANSLMIVSGVFGTIGTHNDENGTDTTLNALKTLDFYNTARNNWTPWDIDENINPSAIWTICQHVAFPYFQWQPAQACIVPDSIFGLIFSVTNEKFYLDINNNGIYDSAIDEEYIGQTSNWAWNAATETLTLTDFSWITPAEVALTIESMPGHYTIHINGKNTFQSILNVPSLNKTAGIMTNNGIKLIINGTANDTLYAIGGYSFYCNSYGIRLDASDFVINGVTVYATGGTAASATSYGIDGDGIINAGTLFATGGDGMSSIGLNKNKTIEGGNVTVTSGTATSSSSIAMDIGSIEMNGGTLTAISGTSVSVSICIKASNSIIINGGEINATSPDADYGIDCYAFEMNNGTITAQGNTQAIQTLTTISTLPMIYSYWTNTLAAPGGTEISYPANPAFDNTDDIYKYVKIEELLALFCGGYGTTTYPYQICNAAQLDSVRYFLNKKFVLNNNIDVQDNSFAFDNTNGWKPIGNDATTPFKGTFNGKGFKVYNLWIDRPTTDYVGLFGYTKSAFIDSLGVEIAAGDSIKGQNYVGGLIGTNELSNIGNCYTIGTVIGTGSEIGGLLGNTYDAFISNCYTITSVKGDNYIGGLLGSNQYSNIENCYAAGNIEGNSITGGLVGRNYNSSITNCVAANDTISNISGTDINRIVGEYSGGYLSNNYANSAMIINTFPFSGTAAHNNENGENKTIAELKSFTFYNTSTTEWYAWNIDTITNPAAIWQICTNGSLPYFQWQQGVTCPPDSIFGLVFNIADGKFYLDVNRNSLYDAGIDPEYIEQTAAWNWTYPTLELTDFEWITPAERALSIDGGTELTININGINTFKSTAIDAQQHTAGIYAPTSITLTINGNDTLIAIGGNSSAIIYSYGIDANVTIDSGTIEAIAGDAFSSYGIYSDTIILNGGKLTSTSGTAAIVSCGSFGDKIKLNGGEINSTSGTATNSFGIFAVIGIYIDTANVVATAIGASGTFSYGIYCNQSIYMTGGTVTAIGNAQAIYVAATLNLPIAYRYWTSTSTSDPGGIGDLVPNATAFVNSTTYKFVKIEESETQYGLIYSITDEKFYLDKNGNGLLDAITIDPEYTGQSANWSFGNDTLYLNNFEWITPAPVALTIVGSNTLNIDITGINTFTSVFNGASTITSAGIYNNAMALTIDGSGTLNANAGNATAIFYSNGIFSDLIVNGGTINAIANTADNYSFGILGDVTLNNGTIYATSAAAGDRSYGIYGNVTLNGGTLTAESATALYSFGINATNILIYDGTFTAQGDGQAILTSSFMLPTAYKYWNSQILPYTPSGTGTIVPGATPLSYDPSDKFVKITSIEYMDLEITKTVDNPTPNVGDTITYTITIENYGPYDATNITVFDTLPSGLTFLSASTTQYDATTGMWTIPSLLNGNSEILTIETIVTTVGTITNTAFISASDQLDTDLLNDTSSVILTSSIVTPILTLSESPASPAIYGDNVTLTATLTNAYNPTGTITFIVNGTNVDTQTVTGNGTYTYILITPNVGTYDFEAEYSGDINNNPEEAVKIIGYNVIAKDITVTALGGTSVYGDSPTNPELSATGLVNGETIAVLTGLSNSFNITSTTPVGTYTLNVNGTLTNSNYNISDTIDGTWIVSKRPLTITAIDETINAGETPILDYQITSGNLVNGDVLTGALAVDNLNVGTHTITQGTLTAGNDYSITFVTGTLTVISTDVYVIAITVNGDTTERDNDKFYILATCGDNSVEVNVILSSQYATVEIDAVAQNPRIVNLPNYGKNIINIKVIALNGDIQNYTLTIDKPVPTNVAYYDRFKDVLTVPIHIDGIGAINSVEWYRNDHLLDRDPSKGYLDITETGIYYAIINGNIRTCEINKTAKTAKSLTAYPNPTSGDVEVICSGFEFDKLQVFDINGKLVLESKTATFTIHSLPQGSYIIKVNDLTTGIIKN